MAFLVDNQTEETLLVLDRVAPKGKRSRLISEAVMHFGSSRSRSYVEKQLKVGALANATRDMAIAEEWFPLEEETWRQRTRPRTKGKE